MCCGRQGRYAIYLQLCTTGKAHAHCANRVAGALATGETQAGLLHTDIDRWSTQERCTGRATPSLAPTIDGQFKIRQLQLVLLPVILLYRQLQVSQAKRFWLRAVAALLAGGAARY